MATILAHIKIYEGKEQEFEDTVKALHASTHELEPRCRRYEYWRAAKPSTYYCLLSFEDFVAFMEHQTSDHHEAPEFPSLLESIELEWVDPIQGASDLTPTQPQSMPSDASALMKQYAETHAVQMQDWWQKLR